MASIYTYRKIDTDREMDPTPDGLCGWRIIHQLKQSMTLTWGHRARSNPPGVELFDEDAMQSFLNSVTDMAEESDDEDIKNAASEMFEAVMHAYSSSPSDRPNFPSSSGFWFETEWYHKFKTFRTANNNNSKIANIFSLFVGVQDRPEFDN